MEIAGGLLCPELEGGVERIGKAAGDFGSYVIFIGPRQPRTPTRSYSLQGIGRIRPLPSRNAVLGGPSVGSVAGWKSVLVGSRLIGHGGLQGWFAPLTS